MQQNRRKKRRSGSAALAVLLITAIVIAAGVFIAHRMETRKQEQEGFLQNETSAVTEQGELASFSWGAQAQSKAAEGSIDTPEASTGLPEVPSSAALMPGITEGTTAVPETPAVSTTVPTPMNGFSTTVAINSFDDTPTTTSVPTTETTAPAASSTTAAAVSTTVHNYGEGAEYAYAYAGFTPKEVDVNARDWKLMLVNRDYILPQDYSPALAEAAKGTGVRMDARVAPEYQKMYDAAKKDGITLTPLSGHRRISTQKTNFENKINYYMSQGYDRTTATQKAAQIILPPGTSEHNAGLAMDIISLDVSFENTAAFRWLQEHAQDYGFILRYPKNKESITAITYEPWHWRYVGVEDAKKIKASGQCLEEYLGVVS